jgi:hypothetical protein
MNQVIYQMEDSVDSKPYRIILNFTSIDEGLSPLEKFNMKGTKLADLFILLDIPTDQRLLPRFRRDGVVIGLDNETYYQKLLQCNNTEFDIKEFKGSSIKTMDELQTTLLNNRITPPKEILDAFAELRAYHDSDNE